MAEDNPELQAALRELDRELEVREDPAFEKSYSNLSYSAAWLTFVFNRSGR